MSNLAREIMGPAVLNDEYPDGPFPDARGVIYTDNVRETVAQKFEEIARKLRSGELNGASCYWNDNPEQPAMVYVECLPVVDGKRTALMKRCTFEPAAARMRLVEGA